MAKKSRKKSAAKGKKKPAVVAKKKRKTAAKKKTARKAKPKPKRKGVIATIVGAASAVVDTLTDAERLHHKLEPHVSPDPE
ncbi:MAG TPA: hypothetical protein VGF53_06625 [Pseudolabrys sp.]|jgi:hypothetical protein